MDTLSQAQEYAGKIKQSDPANHNDLLMQYGNALAINNGIEYADAKEMILFCYESKQD